MYPQNYQYQRNHMNYRDDRFIVPFLLGGLAGGAAVGLTRPRPIYNVAPQGGPRPYPAPGMPYYNSSYSYYQPIPRVYYY